MHICFRIKSNLLIVFNFEQEMAAGEDIAMPGLKSLSGQSCDMWKEGMERNQSQVDVLQEKVNEIKASI